MRRRRIGFLFIFGAAVPLAVAAAAWACGNLATLNVSPKVGGAGTTVTASGTNYRTTTGISNIEIHLDTRDGPVLKSIPPAESFTTDVTIPAGTSAGYHLLVATQYTATGVPVSGTPGRTTFRVAGASGTSAVPAASPWSSAKPPGGSEAAIRVDAGDPSGPALPALLALALSLGLLGVGVKLVRSGGFRAQQQPLLGA